MLAWSRATWQPTCCFLATWENAHHFHICFFGPISLTLGISLPTVTSKAKLWPCQRTPRHKRRPHQNCLLGAMQKMENVARSVTQKQTTFRSRMHETCGMYWHGRSTKKYLYQKMIHRVTRIKMHNCMLVRTYIFV